MSSASWYIHQAVLLSFLSQTPYLISSKNSFSGLEIAEILLDYGFHFFPFDIRTEGKSEEGGQFLEVSGFAYLFGEVLKIFFDWGDGDLDLDCIEDKLFEVNEFFFVDKKLLWSELFCLLLTISNATPKLTSGMS
jgi:hypothetical protein